MIYYSLQILSEILRTLRLFLVFYDGQYRLVPPVRFVADPDKVFDKTLRTEEAFVALETSLRAVPLDLVYQNVYQQIPWESDAIIEETRSEPEAYEGPLRVKQVSMLANFGYCVLNVPQQYRIRRLSQYGHPTFLAQFTSLVCQRWTTPFGTEELVVPLSLLNAGDGTPFVLRIDPVKRTMTLTQESGS